MALSLKFDKRIEGLETAEELLGHHINLSNAEVVSVHLDRRVPSITIVVFVPFINNYTTPYILTFVFDDVDNIQLENFNHQNVLMNFVLEPQEGRIAASFWSKFGVEIFFHVWNRESDNFGSSLV